MTMREKIERLHREAAGAGDLAMVQWCVRALDEDEPAPSWVRPGPFRTGFRGEAWEVCVAAIRAAEAMHTEEER
jgi:hypothetical protein